MFSLFASIQIVRRNTVPRFSGIPNSSLLIRLEKALPIDTTGVFVRNIDRGSQGKIRYNQNGVIGQWISVPYGDTEILFSVPKPLEVFDLEFNPDYYSWDYTISIFIPTPNPIFDVLTEKWGLDAGILSTLPIQLLDLLMILDPSKSSDTRNMIATIEAADAKATAAASAATNAQTTADNANTTLVSVQSEMVEQRDFDVLGAAFVLIGDKMVATVTHDLTGAKPQMSLIDASGDEQGFSQLIASSPTTCKIELTQNQFANADFPLVLTVQGKNGSQAMAGNWVTIPNGTTQYRILNGNLDRQEADGSGGMSIAEDVVRGVLSGNGNDISYENTLGQYFVRYHGNIGAPNVPSNSGNHEAMIDLTGSIVF